MTTGMAWTSRYGTSLKQYMGRKRKEMPEERLKGKNNFKILSK